MGITEDNIELIQSWPNAAIRSHRNPSDSEDQYRFECGGAVSGWFSQVDDDAMSDAAQVSRSDFEEAAEDAVGASYWSARSTAEIDDLFDWYKEGVTGKLKFRLHRGNQSVNRVSSWSTAAQAEDLFADSVVSFAAFDATAAVVWGSDWTDDPPMSTARRQGFRSAAIDF